MKPLAKRTVGCGRASARRLLHPIQQTGVFIWQGIISNSDEKLKIVIPIPSTWLSNATEPHLRLVVCWETPVNDANSSIWACRKVEVQLKPGLADGVQAARGSNSPHATYPWIDRKFDLKKILDGNEAEGDSWLLEIAYTEIGMAEYYLGITPDPNQRVGLVAELYDAAENPVSPQPFLQGLPIASTLDRLSILQPSTRVTVSIPRT